MTAVQDIGRPINPLLAEGQVEDVPAQHSAVELFGRASAPLVDARARDAQRRRVEVEADRVHAAVERAEAVAPASAAGVQQPVVATQAEPIEIDREHARPRPARRRFARRPHARKRRAPRAFARRDPDTSALDLDETFADCEPQA